MKHGNADVVTLIITVTIKPEIEQEFLAVMRDYARTMDEQEPEGNTLYCVLGEEGDDKPPHTYVMLQRYATHEAHEAHRQKSYRNEGLAKLMTMVSKPPEFRIFRQVIPT